MKRRDFINAGVAALATEFIANNAALADSPRITAYKTTRLFDSATVGGDTCQDAIWDGQRFLCLFRPAQDISGSYGIAASTLEGVQLWTYALPAGYHLSLGTYTGTPLIFAAGYTPKSGPRISNPVWLLDPNTGTINMAAVTDGKGLFCSAGDSRFFRVVAGLGEVWAFDGVLSAKATGLSAQSFAPISPFIAAVTHPSGVAIVTLDGKWIATVSAVANSVEEVPIVSPFIASVGSFYQAYQSTVVSGARLDPEKQKLAKPTVISAIGADEGGTLYALVVTPNDPPGVLPLVRFDSGGNGSAIATILIPKNKMAWKLCIFNSQLGVVSRRGDIDWYNLPVS